MQSTMMHYPLTLNQFLERAGKFYPTREIVSHLPDKSLHRYSFGDFQRRALRLAEALQRAGLQRGERVATFMWNHYAHLEAYFGVPAAGGVLHTLNLRLAPEEIAYIVNHAEDRFILVDDVLLPLFEKFKAQINPERVIVFSFSGAAVPAPYENYETFLQSARGEFTFPEIDENDPCGMCYTSGTTGRPKGVVYSHRSNVLHAFAAAMADSMALRAADCVLPVVPMFHANAWAVPYVAVMVGAKIVFPGPHLDGESVCELFAAERVTVSCGVPTVWLGVLQTLRANPGRWQFQPGMRMTCGGSAVPESLMRSFAQLDMHIIQGWGMTETSPVATLGVIKPELMGASVDEQFALRTKQGVALPFVDLRLMGDAGAQPWDGLSVGEVQVRGPWITGSYYKLPQSDSFSEDGWLRTGDVGVVDAHGYLKLTDRTKDLIKSGGEWISSVDLENAIMGHPAVQEAAVIAVPHPKWAERPLAVVVLKAGQRATPEELRGYLSDQFAKWQIPDAYAFVDAIPRTSTGKFLKTKLREMYQDWSWQEAG
jgi:fatty-acyl-CoA synthase